MDVSRSHRFHAVLKSVLLDKKWATKHHYRCFSGDSKPIPLSAEVVYRPDVVWKTKHGTLHIVEIPTTENCRAVVGEFFLACGIDMARHFTAMVSEDRKWLKPYLKLAWNQLWQLSRGDENPANCQMCRPRLVAVPNRLGNDKKLIQKYLEHVWVRIG